MVGVNGPEPLHVEEVFTEQSESLSMLKCMLAV